jgi:hypothetical protein
VALVDPTAQGWRRLGPSFGLLVVGLATTWFALHARPAVRAYQDSGMYLEGARQLAEGQGFTTVLVPLAAREPAAITAYAPGFSFLMLPFALGGLDARESAAVVLVLAYVAYALFTYWLVLAAARERWWPAAGVFTLALALQPTVLQYVSSILSDLPFAAGTTAVAWLAVRWVRRDDPSPRAALAIGVCLGLTTLVRWSGLHLGVVLGLGVFVSLPAALPALRRLHLVALLGLGGALVVVPWLVRNRLSGGFLTGDRYVTLHDPATILGHALSGLAAGRADAHELLGSAAPALDLVVLVAASGLVVALVRGRAWQVRHARLLAVLALGYAALLVTTAFLHIVDSLVAPRYWLPVWPLLGAFGLAALAHAQLRPRARTLVLAAWLVPVVPTAVAFNAHRVHMARPEVEVERYFLDEALARSAPVAYVRSKGRDCAVVSNFSLPLTLHARPRLVHALLPDPAGLRAFVDEQERVCIVYFHRRDVYRKHPDVDPGPALETLAREGRIRRIQRDGFGEVWVKAATARR